MTREAPEFNGALSRSTWSGAAHPGIQISVSHFEVPQNLSVACEMARVAFEVATAELDNVAEDSYKDPTLFRQCSVNDLSLVQMIAPRVEHESVLRCVRCVCTMWSPATVQGLLAT